QVTLLSGGSDPAHEVMPRVHLVASLLKRWLIGTHQGGRPASTSRLLPRRIHLPLQSPQIKGPRAALSSPRPTSPRRWTRALQRHRQASGFQRLSDNGAMKGIPIFSKIGGWPAAEAQMMDDMLQS